MDNALSNAKIPGYAGVQVASFKAGSTVAETIIKFAKGATVNPSVASNVGDKIKAAAENGDLDSLGLHPDATFEPIIPADSESSIFDEIRPSSSKILIWSYGEAYLSLPLYVFMVLD